MSNEVFDGKVTLKMKGKKQIVWEYPNENELQAIAEFVADSLKNGVKVEHFEIQRMLKIL